MIVYLNFKYLIAMRQVVRDFLLNMFFFKKTSGEQDEEITTRPFKGQVFDLVVSSLTKKTRQNY